MVKLREIAAAEAPQSASMFGRLWARVSGIVPQAQREQISVRRAWPPRFRFRFFCDVSPRRLQGATGAARRLWLTGWHFVAGKTWWVAISGVVLVLPLQLGAAFDQAPPSVMQLQ